MIGNAQHIDLFNKMALKQITNIEILQKLQIFYLPFSAVLQRKTEDIVYEHLKMYKIKFYYKLY